MFKTCPDPVDVQDLQFKLHCRLKVFDNKELGTFPKTYGLISCASRYGLLFVGSNSSNLQVIQEKHLENYSVKDKDISNYPRRNINLPSPPQHISVNCDSTILAVVTESDNCANVIFYDVLSFFKQNISVIKEVRLSSTPGVFVREVGWNPVLPSLFTACKNDGTLGVYEIQGNSININELPAASEATCFCWSPKGKQIAVGSKNSRITQYKPDLKAVKVINQPPLEAPHSLISLQWVSNYQFIGIYQSAGPEGTAKLVVVDAPKTGDVTYTNYEDVCYSGTTRLPQFYMLLQPHWNILMVASSNSTELGVLGSTGDTWTQWIISDSARAELPLSSDHQETLPVGLGLDISSTRPLPWNESVIPPCPYLLILSHQGVLCLFSVINLKQGIPSICTPPDAVSDLSGLQQFVTPSENANERQNVEPPKISAPSVGTVQNVPATQATVFGAKILTQPQPTYSMPENLFGTKPLDNKPLFGSLTPIRPQQSAATALFGGQTLVTPVAKQQTITSAAATPAEKYSTIYSALNASAIAPPAAETKTVVLNIPKPAAPVEQSGIVQPKPELVTGKEPETPKAVNLKMKEETDVLLAQMVKDECIALESELKALLHQGRLLNVNIGSEEEKIELIEKIEFLQSFIKEIVDISIGENAEIHYLKQNLIQSWAWYEEARSRYNTSKDETVSLLLRSQPLDSATEKKQADIRKMKFYIESQIMQASKALDEQWDNFQDYAKKVHRTKMPTMETIFQAMVRQNVILQKQTYILKDIANRLKGKGQAMSIPSLLLSVDNTKDLEESLNRLKIEHPQDIYQVQYERVLNRMKNLSEGKTNKLRKLLKNREVLHVAAVKPQLSSSLILQSPESKSRRLLSNLAASGTPSPALKIKTNLNTLSFMHSTPIREIKPDVKSTEVVPVATQADTRTFAFKKVEKGNVPSAANRFVPLSKSASVFSNLPQEGITQTPIATHPSSAFVPTQVNFGGGSKFSFASAAPTTTTTVAKTIPISAPVATTAPSSFGATTASNLPNFGTPVLPKSPSSAVTDTLTKPSLPQFSFGSGSSVNPVATTEVAMTKPSFSFSSTTNLFGAKSSLTTTSQSAVSNTSFFSNLAQSNKPFAGSGIPNTSKFSAFSAVTTIASNLPLSVATISTSSKPEELPKPSIFASSIVAESGSSESVTSPSNLTTALAATTISSPKALSTENVTMSSATAIPTTVTTFEISSTPVVVTKATSLTSSVASLPTELPSTTALVFPTPVTTKQTLMFGSSSVTTSASPASSGTFVFPVTTAAATKPTSSSVSSSGTTSSTQSLFFGGTVTVGSSPTTTTSLTTTSTQLSTSVKPFSSQSSLFGTSQQTGDEAQNQGSINVSLPSGTTIVPLTQSSIFGGTTSGVGSTTQSTSIFSSGQGSTSQSSIFGSAVNTTQSSIFGGNQTTVSQQPSFFGGSSTIPSGTIASTQSSIFGGVQNTTSTITTAQSSSIFGSSKTTTTSQSSIFNSISSLAQSSLFDSSSANSPAATTTQSSPFGVPFTNLITKPFASSATSVSSQPSVFGTNTATSTQQGSIFGGAANTGSTSIFGSAQTSIFGGSQANTTQNSIFGANNVPSTQTSIFGTATTSASPFASTFGSSSTLSSPFGQASPVLGVPKTTASTFGSGFGSPTGFGTTPATTSSVFGQQSSFGGTSPSVFGTPTTTATSVFGSPTSAFGTNTSTNVFGSPATSTSSFSFAGSGNTAGATGSFGFGGLNVGNSATTNSAFGSGSPFAQTTVANPFSRAAEQKSPFGGNSSNIFGNPASTSGSIFGSNTGSISSNSQSNFGAASFGSSPAFGQQSAFGQSSFGGSPSFGSTQPGPFSGGSTAVAQTGFGSPTGFAKPSGFGSAPAFGGSPQPAFGAAPSFGGAPTFGATAAFGSPNKVFGSNTPSAGFGSASTASAGFGSLANQNTVGFGNLAQQATTPNAAPFSGSSSFSSWR